MNAIAYFDKRCSPIYGTIRLHQCDSDSDTFFNLDLHGFEPNKIHAIHIHEYGNISGGCMTSGGHYNPYNKNHGCVFLHGKNRHAGDLINNIISDSYGNIEIKFHDDLVNLSGKYSVIGRTIVIHYNMDDLGLGGLEDGKIVNKKVHKESLKTGNAGGRMTCAIIGIDK